MNVLVANKNLNEGEKWRILLKKNGYKVATECSDLSAFVYMMARDKIHFVVCGVSLIEKNAFNILNAVTKFFPRVKIIIVGNMGHSQRAKILNYLPNVVVRSAFGTDLEKYWEIPAETKKDFFKDTEQQLSLLLDEHFLSYEEAAIRLAKAMPQMKPDYVVICVKTDSFYSQACGVIMRKLRELRCGYAAEVRFNEICVVLDDSPNEELCFSVAEAIRYALLTETDTSFSIGISRRRKDAAELYICRKEAERAASMTHLYGQDSVVHVAYFSDSDIGFIYPEHKERKLIEHALDGNKEESLRMLAEIFEPLTRLTSVNQAIINKIGLGIMVKLNIAATSRAKAFEKAQMDSMSTGKLLAAKTIEEVYIILKEGIEAFADEMIAINDIRRDVLYMRLTELKKAGINLSVSELLRMLHTTISFLNSAIAQNTGGNIFDFLEHLEQE